ncbi:MAG TPA: hypothetical protein VF502_15665 [Stellaceae bacterium]
MTNGNTDVTGTKPKMARRSYGLNLRMLLGRHATAASQYAEYPILGIAAIVPFNLRTSLGIEVERAVIAARALALHDFASVTAAQIAA